MTFVVVTNGKNSTIYRLPFVHGKKKVSLGRECVLSFFFRFSDRFS